jgi:hypothetical protein
MQRPSFLLLASMVLLLPACVTTIDGREVRKESSSDSPWLEPSPVLREQIRDQIERMPWTHGADRVDQIRWLASVGEPAYEMLLPVCLDPRPDVAGSALAALGATGDSRLVEPLRALDWQPEMNMDKGLLLERARTYVRLGDWSQVQVLIDGLRDDELWTRSWCAQALHEATKMRFDYDPHGEPEARAAAVERWQQWLDSRRVEGLLPGERRSGR